MNLLATIVIDAGHGGFDNGASFQGRKEKDDNLRLALAVGEKLEQMGYDVIYTRTEDIYQSPYEKAQIANEANADYFISFHRNSSEGENNYSGSMSLIYGGDERARRLAESINEQLEKSGFTDLGIDERTGLVVLRRTKMPAVLIEAGFINNEKDNQIFDNNFNAIASNIAQGIADVVPLSNSNTKNNESMETEEAVVNRKDTRYSVEVGRFRYETTANYMAEQLREKGIESFVYRDSGVIHVIAGNLDNIEDAVYLQGRLRNLGYMTMIVSQSLVME